jgi:peptidoglycan/xylan/chitin deacetylase (PgdA/CDA1 family)
MLDGEDARGVSSTFFVIASHTHKQDGNQPEAYRRRIPEALSLLSRHGREIGLHGNDADRLALAEVVRDRRDLAGRAGQPVTGVRYHYLRALYHETLPLLEQAGFEYDTTLAFAEHEGFRCGCSFPFRPYSLTEERPLDLVELPLAVMDGTLQQPHYRDLPAQEAERTAAAVFARVRASGGASSLLWHNNRFDPRLSRGYDKVYWSLVDGVLEHGGIAASAGSIVARWRKAVGLPEPSCLEAAEAPPCACRGDAAPDTRSTA